MARSNEINNFDQIRGYGVIPEILAVKRKTGEDLKVLQNQTREV